jgi:hypothetical protein
MASSVRGCRIAMKRTMNSSRMSSMIEAKLSRNDFSRGKCERVSASEIKDEFTMIEFVVGRACNYANELMTMHGENSIVCFGLEHYLNFV